ncbi:MAG: DUF2892 domain-containing protein [Thiothrix sp.]|nr:DUF2892 domain-containing protein [Thiothrix sp.]HPQ94725.1 DUF2892 domain-containing protein [Thiolinea sp.]
MNLERNVGRNDKNIRIAVGLVLLVIGLFKSFWLALLGLIVLGTGVFSFCALYKVLGINTATPAEQAAASADLSERASRNIDDFKAEVVETTEEITEEVKETAGEWKDKAGELADKIEDNVEDAVDSAKKKVSEFSDSMKKKS